MKERVKKDESREKIYRKEEKEKKMREKEDYSQSTPRVIFPTHFSRFLWSSFVLSVLFIYTCFSISFKADFLFRTDVRSTRNNLKQPFLCALSYRFSDKCETESKYFNCDQLINSFQLISNVSHNKKNSRQGV